MEMFCRVCLSKDASVFHSLVDQSARDLLFEWTFVWVEPEDGYPQQVCGQCWNRCQSWSDFKELAQATDRQLRLKRKAKEGYSLAPTNEEGELKTPSNQRSETEEGPSVIRAQQTFVCGHRSETFRSLFKLKLHEVNRAKDRPFSCDECERRFRRKQDLHIHKVAHIGIKAFKCDRCTMAFALLIKHKRVHTQKHTNTIMLKEQRKKINIKCSKCGEKFEIGSSYYQLLIKNDLSNL